MADTEFKDYIDWMGLNDQNLAPWGGERESVDPGEYTFEITKALQDPSKSGKPMMTLINKVVSSGPMEGREMRSWFSMQPGLDVARRRMKAIAMATGVSIDGRGGFSVQSFVGRRFRGKVVREDWEERNKTTGEMMSRTGAKIISETSV